MTKRIQSKYKINRRYGVNLWGRPKSPVNTRNYAPGEHGQKRRKPSDYGVQLAAKQKLRGYYGNVSEKQMLRLYKEAMRRKGDNVENLINLMERRLDAVVYRMKFIPTVFSSRQIINHGHILVNGKRVNIPSYQVKDGDVIEVRQRSKEMALIIEASKSNERDVPDYISVDADKLKGQFIRGPKFEEVPYPVQMEPHMVIEYYSR